MTVRLGMKTGNAELDRVLRELVDHVNRIDADRLILAGPDGRVPTDRLPPTAEPADPDFPVDSVQGLTGDVVLYPRMIGARDLTGFDNRTDSAVSMNGTTFSIAPVVNQFDVWLAGEDHIYDEAQTVTIPQDYRPHFIYFNSEGVLEQSSTFPGVEGAVAMVHIAIGNGSVYALFEERHHADRDRRWHGWAHLYVGARYGYGLTGTFNNTTFSITQGVIADEDLPFDTAATKTNGRIWYRRTGAENMTFENGVTLPYKANAGSIQYDASGVLTNVSNNYYTAVYFWCGPSSDYPIQIVVGQNQYQGNTAGLAACRAEARPTMPGTPHVEWRLLYQVIFQNQSGTPTYIEANDRREVSTGPAGSPTSGSHAALVHRDLQNQHPESAISFTDITDGNATTGQHGYMPKLSGTDTDYLGGDGQFHEIPDPDLSGVPMLGSSNEYSEAQTVNPSYLSADVFGEVAWDTDAKQNCELTVDGNITDWVIQGGAAGRVLHLRLSMGGSYSVSFPSATFKAMDDFALPASGYVTHIGFRMQSDSVLEYLGQSPEFEEWDI